MPRPRHRARRWQGPSCGQSQPTNQCRTLHSALLGSLGGFISLHVPQTCLRKWQWVHFGKSSLGAAYCTGFPQSSHPGAQEGCSRQRSRLALCCGTAGTGTEQSQHAATLFHSSSYNMLTSVVGNSLLLLYLFREGAGKELSDNHSGKNMKLLLTNSQQAPRSYPTCTSQMICGRGINAPEWRITTKCMHEYSSELRTDTDPTSLLAMQLTKCLKKQC